MNQIKVCFYFLVFFVLGQVRTGIGQENKIIPSTPEAAALSKMISYPVSLNTGVPSITIPIYSIDINGISMPINLSYHAGGIKVNQQSTWVGLGWNLDLEPQITRSINGKDDFNGYLTNSHVKAWGSYVQGDLLYQNDLAEGNQDEQPDRFNYKLISGTGSFMYQKYNNNEYEALAIPYKPIKINYNDNNFEIIDEQGRNYLFDIKQNTIPNTTSGIFERTSWKCSRIISSSKSDTVSFQYNEKNNILNYSFSDRVEVIDSTSSSTERATIYNYSSSIGGEPIGTQYPEGGTEPWGIRGLFIKDVINPSGIGFHYGYIKTGDVDPNPQIIKSKVEDFTLKQINFRGGVIKLYSQINDQFGSKLDSIKIFDRDNRVIKVIRFYLGFFNLIQDDDPIKSDYRLRLDSIVVSGHSGSNREVYSFDYITPQTAPGYIYPWTKASDAWGYHNNNGSGAYIGSSVPMIENVSVADPNAPEIILRNYRTMIGSADTQPYEVEMKYFMLTKITYPTGGRTEFEYAANKYLDMGELKLAGGVRIEKIKIFTNSSDINSSMEKIYKYGENESGAGELKINPDFANYSYEQKTFNTDGSNNIVNRKRTFLSRALEDLFYANGCPVNYTTVTEYQKDEGSLTGKIIYRFGKFEVGDGVLSFYNGTRYINTSLTCNRIEIKGGELLSTTKYAFNNGQYDWIQHDTSTYTQYLKSDQIHVGKIFRKVIYGSQSLFQQWGSGNDFVYFDYPQPVGNNLLTKRESKSRSLDNPSVFLSQKVNYYYDNPSHQQPTRIETIKSDGSTESSFISYPLDYASGNAFIDNMRTNNLVTYPIEQVKYLEKGINKVILSGVLNQYDSTGNGLIEKKYAIEATSPISLDLYKFSNRLTGVLPPSGTGTVFSMDSRYKEKVTYNSYDYRSNLLTVTAKDNMPLSYVWDYDVTYPIAQVSAANQNDIAYTSFESDGKGNWTYSGTPFTEPLSPTGKKVYDLSSGNITKSINSATTYIISYWRPIGLSSLSIGGTINDYPISGRTVNGWKYYEHKISAQSTATISGSGNIDELRLYPEKALMTTYTYDPLIGMTSQCDVNNRITYYEYDGFGRLMLVRDQDKNILKQLCYNYAGQQQDCNASYAPAAPPAPGNLSAVINTGSAVDLNWVNNAVNATVNEVYRSAGDATHYALLVTLPDNVSTYTDTQTDINTLYFYKIKAAGSGGNSDFSNEKSITTPAVSPSALSNTAPIINDIADIYVRSGSSKTVNITATDDVGDILGFVVTGIPAFAAFLENGNGAGVFHLSPINTTPGNFSATVKVIDNYGAFSQKVINIIVVATDSATYRVNFNNIDYPVTDPLWNSFNAPQTGGTQVAANTTLYALKDETGTASALSVKLMNSWPQNYLGVVTGNDSGVYPDAVIATGYYFYVQASAPQKTIKIAGLKADKKYDLTFYGNRSFASDQITNYTVGAQTVTLNSRNNISNTVQITGLAANGQGEIDIVVDAAMTKYALINAMVIKEYPNN